MNVDLDQRFALAGGLGGFADRAAFDPDQFDRADLRLRQGFEQTVEADPGQAVFLDVLGNVAVELDLGRGPDGTALDGATLVDHLCRSGWRVIVLSATTDEPRIGRALDAGALACVPKTAALPVLLTAIRRATQGVEVMRPERRQYFIEQYHRRQEQARAVERRLARLTERERSVLGHLARGHRAQSIADEFGVSLATIRTQIRAVLQKLNVGGQLEAVALLNEYRRMTEDG